MNDPTLLMSRLKGIPEGIGVGATAHPTMVPHPPNHTIIPAAFLQQSPIVCILPAVGAPSNSYTVSFDHPNTQSQFSKLCDRPNPPGDLFFARHIITHKQLLTWITLLTRHFVAAEMGRSTTAVPRPHRTHDEKGIYPTHMLPSSPTPIRAERSTMAPFSSYEDPYASHHSYRSPLHSPPPSSNDSTTSANSAGSPPPSLPQSPTRQARNVHNSSHVYGHAHGRHHSLSTNVYPVTDYASTSGAKLLPRQPTKRHTQQYTSSHSGLGAVGPALAQNIPPVLPRPPSLKGSSLSSQGLGRSGSLGRNGTIRKGDVKTITDEEQAAYAALNTYR